MWGHSVQFWQSIADWLLVVALILGALTVISSFASSMISGQALKRFQTDADQRIAEVRQEAEEAKARAAEADLARIELEARIAPRRLDSTSQEKLRSSLQVFSGRFIRIESYPLDLEGEILATQIRDALAPVLDIEDWIGAERASGNYAKGINVSGDDEALVNALASALRDVGLTAVSTEPLPPPTEAMLLFEESRSKSPNVAATLLVGVKPIAQ